MKLISKADPESQPSLPIRDQEALQQALIDGELPTLLMVYVSLSHDAQMLERFAPYIGSIFETPPEAPKALRAELRERLFELLTQNPPPRDIAPNSELMRHMLSTAVGEPVGDEFIPMLKEQMGFEPPEMRSQRPARQAPASDFKVLVIGAGLTGILAGIKLREAGYRFQIIEKNPEIGGTWWENTYPGCGVDTPSHFYSYSFELNPSWSHYTPNGPEFQRYLLEVVKKYDLRRDITFETRVVSCVYDDERALWQVTLEDAAGRRVVEANAVINAHGPLNRWSFPKIKGLESFKGKLMHTAAWDSTYALEGKRVAMIGTGASGTQLGGAIAGQVEHLTVIQRSRHWVMPNHYVPVPESVRWAQENIPHYAEWFRFRSYWFAADGLYENIKMDPEWPHQERSVSAYNDGVREYCLKNYQEKLADRPDLMEKLIPDYPVFGKRIVMDINWLETLKRDNVSLENTAIAHVSEDAIVLVDGRRIEVDAILCATGFDIADMTGKLEVVGRGGRNLREEWGGDDPDPRAYLGVTVPGYPNFFLTVGPNSAPNHAGGQNITSETQIHYILECLELLQARNVAALEPSEAACQRFNDEVDEVLKGLIWSHPKAQSYYKNRSGRIFLSSPYRLVDYWSMTRAPRIEDYVLHGEESCATQADALQERTA